MKLETVTIAPATSSFTVPYKKLWNLQIGRHFALPNRVKTDGIFAAACIDPFLEALFILDTTLLVEQCSPLNSVCLLVDWPGFLSPTLSEKESGEGPNYD